MLGVRRAVDKDFANDWGPWDDAVDCFKERGMVIGLIVAADTGGTPLVPLSNVC